MSFTPELIAELEVLALFNLDSHQKASRSTATLPLPWWPQPAACTTSNSPTSPMVAT